MIASSFVVVCLINLVSHTSLKRECKNWDKNWCVKTPHILEAVQ